MKAHKEGVAVVGTYAFETAEAWEVVEHDRNGCFFL